MQSHRLVISPPQFPFFVMSSDGPSAIWLKVAEKKASSLLSVPLQSLLWWFLSLSLSSEHQWLNPCSHPSLSVNCSKYWDIQLYKVALAIPEHQASSRVNYRLWESNLVPQDYVLYILYSILFYIVHTDRYTHTMSFSLIKEGGGRFPPRKHSVEKAHKLHETMCFSHMCCVPKCKLDVEFPVRFVANK